MKYNWYKIAKIAKIAKLQKTSGVKNGDWVFGYIDSMGYIESTVVPKEKADSLEEKGGLTHFDIFGYNIMNKNSDTWRYRNGKVYWYGTPDIELEDSVESILDRKYGIHNVVHMYGGI